MIENVGIGGDKWEHKNSIAHTRTHTHTLFLLTQSHLFLLGAFTHTKWLGDVPPGAPVVCGPCANPLRGKIRTYVCSVTRKLGRCFVIMPKLWILKKPTKIHLNKICWSRMFVCIILKSCMVKLREKRYLQWFMKQLWAWVVLVKLQSKYILWSQFSKLFNMCYVILCEACLYGLMLDSHTVYFPPSGLRDTVCK